MDDVLGKCTKYKENSVLLQNYILRLSLQYFNGNRWRTKVGRTEV